MYTEGRLFLEDLEHRGNLSSPLILDSNSNLPELAWRKRNAVKAPITSIFLL